MTKVCPKRMKCLPFNDSECLNCEYMDTVYTDDEANLLKCVCTISDYIYFGDFCHGVLGVTTQYGSYMFDGLADHPEMGKGLRVIKRGIGDYHSYMIHKDDAEIFRQRVNEWLKR